jgi:hypothetical protein
MVKKSVRRRAKGLKSTAIVTEDAIIITLTAKEKKKARESIRKCGVAKFKIKEIKVKAIPSGRVTTEWIFQD